MMAQEWVQAWKSALQGRVRAGRFRASAPIDQHQTSTDKRSGITNDPNREDDPQYILRLIGQVITVSLETVQIVRSLPQLGLREERNSTSATVPAN
jgi:hypothetical protein